jgi:hypothetical protein
MKLKIKNAKLKTGTARKPKLCGSQSHVPQNGQDETRIAGGAKAN